MFDTHAHLFREYYSSEEINEIVSSFEGNIIVSGTDGKSNHEILDLNYKNIYITLGIHPESVLDYKESDLLFIEKNLNNSRVLGIGEIGLDYHYGKENKEKQIVLFRKQLDLARKYDKVVVIHSRDAMSDTINILREYSDLKKVLHCYSGSLESAMELIKINTYFGIGGVVTFKNSNNLINVVKNIPLDRILIETDSPYLSPIRGEKNIPNNVMLIIKKIAEIKGISYDDVLSCTTKNACLLFGCEL